MINEPITVVIPANNEESSIQKVIEKLKLALIDAQITYEIIVVDDGSKDQTSSIAKKAGVHVIEHTKNLGYGAALKSGISVAKHDMIVIADADGTYPEYQIPLIVTKLETADMVVGARIKKNVHIPFLRRPAKWILGRLAGYITGDHIPDLNSGLRAFRRQFVQQYLGILPDKFSFTTTLTVASLCDHYKITYVPIDYEKRSGKSKIVPWDFVEFVALVLRLSMFFNPLKIFIPVAFLSFLLGGIKLLFDIILATHEAGGITWSLFTNKILSSSPLILLLSGLQISLIGMMADGINRKIAHHSPQQLRSNEIHVPTSPDTDKA